MYDKHVFTRRTAQKTTEALVKVLEILTDMPWTSSISNLKEKSKKGSPKVSKVHNVSTTHHMQHPWNSLVACLTGVPNKLAVIDGGRKFTYQDFHNRCSKLGAFLQSQGVSQGSGIGALLPNIHETMEAHFAAAWLGASIVNLNTRLVAHELAYILDDSLPETVIVHHSLLDRVLEAMSHSGSASSVKLILVVRSPGLGKTAVKIVSDLRKIPLHHFL